MTPDETHQDAIAAAHDWREDERERLAWNNRQILADRLHWPDGALQACERIERDHPDWSISWLRENTISGFERPAGYRAVRGGFHSCVVSAATAEELVRAIEGAPPAEHSWEGCEVCIARGEQRIRRAGF